MILRQSVSIKTERESVFAIQDVGKKLLEILLIQKNSLLSVSSYDHMVQRPRKMDSRFARHGNSLSENTARVNTELPLPDNHIKGT